MKTKYKLSTSLTNNSNNNNHTIYFHNAIVDMHYVAPNVPHDACWNIFDLSALLTSQFAFLPSFHPSSLPSFFPSYRALLFPLSDSSPLYHHPLTYLVFLHSIC